MAEQHEQPHTKAFIQKDGSIRVVITNMLLALPNSDCAHVVFVRSDGSMGRLCDTSKSLSRGQWLAGPEGEYDVLTILDAAYADGRTGVWMPGVLTNDASVPEAPFLLIGGPRRIGDHYYLCQRCESSLHSLNHTTRERHPQPPEQAEN